MDERELILRYRGVFQVKVRLRAMEDSTPYLLYHLTCLPSSSLTILESSRTTSMLSATKIAFA